MEDETFLSISSVPSFAQGLKILLVHNDTLSIINLSSMLEKYSFRAYNSERIDYAVTVTDEAKAAVSMICDPEESQFNLVMAKDNMPDMDILSFLHIMLDKYIPVIFICSGEYDDVTWKALAEGSCFFLEEPILFQDLKYVWQHVYHTRVNLAKKTDKENCVNKVHGTLDDRKCLGQEKRKRLEMNFDSNHLTAFMEQDEIEDTERKENYDEHAEKRPRIVWTPELHQKFLDAINVLSDRNNIRPKAILEQMNVPNLTARQISSHLQKYRTQELISQQACISGFTPMGTFSNFDGRFQSSLPFQSQGYPGFPISIAAVGGSQNQSQCSMIFTETQGLEMPQMEEVSLIPDEFATALSNYGSQNREAEVRQPIPDASMDQNQPMRAHDPMKMLEEDYDEHEYSQNGVLSHQIDQYCEMLRNTL
ncbi:two-component response regulator ORR26-like [Neltuma alba]|uniref:two-component response regulator ORR26-like n=1 Tax=Neltuma alba TaxID=207710 RepID=UPI0010A55411|nr:two-component response regulator ORR26-like [Prosopis alba]